jgi:hypothetical protein
MAQPLTGEDDQKRLRVPVRPPASATSSAFLAQAYLSENAG